MKIRDAKRLLIMLFGIFLIGIAVGLFRISGMGTDPFTTMNLGISGFIGMQFGLYQLIVNIILFVIVWKFARNNIGIGTIVNMVSVGFVADFVVNQYHFFIGGTMTLTLKISVMGIAVIIAGLAVALYMTADFGVAPYDAMAIIIEQMTRSKIPFSIARILTDITCVTIGFSFGAIVGVSTLVTAFLTGPIVQFFRSHVTDRLLEDRKDLKIVGKPL